VGDRILTQHLPFAVDFLRFQDRQQSNFIYVEVSSQQFDSCSVETFWYRMTTSFHLYSCDLNLNISISSLYLLQASIHTN